jgi:hypothetical protein
MFCPSNGAKSPWTEPSETVSQKKSSLHNVVYVRYFVTVTKKETNTHALSFWPLFCMGSDEASWGGLCWKELRGPTTSHGGTEAFHPITPEGMNPTDNHTRNLKWDPSDETTALEVPWWQLQEILSLRDPPSGTRPLLVHSISTVIYVCSSQLLSLGEICYTVIISLVSQGSWCLG